MNEFNCEKLSLKEVATSNHGNPVTYYNNHETYNNPNSEFELTYKKIGKFYYTEQTKSFNLKVNMSKDDNFVQITLKRVSVDNPPSFMFEGQLRTTLDRFENPITWNNITEHGGSRKYNFNLGSNVDTFQKIVNCISIKMQ